MLLQRKVGLIVISLLIACNATSGYGAVIVYGFSGILTSVVDMDDVLDPSVVIGSSFAGTLWYETEGAHDTNSNPDIASLALTAGGMQIEFGDTKVQDNGMGLTIGNSTQDYYIFRSVLTEHPLFEHLTVRVELRDFSGTTLDDTSIPAGPIDLADFPDQREFYFSEEMPGVEIFGEITSLTLIPEPATALCLLGLAAPLVRRRRREVW